jgi:recombination protein RecA
MFGSPETTSGGNALKFYSSVRLDIRRIGGIKEAAAGGKEPNVVGNRTRVKVVKNKLAPPFREVEFDILYGQGISHSGDVIDLATEANIVEKSGAWFSFQGERIGQGRENAKTYLETHPALLDKVETLVLAKHGVNRTGKQAPPPAPAAPAGKGEAPAGKGAAPAGDTKRAPAKAN